MDLFHDGELLEETDFIGHRDKSNALRFYLQRNPTNFPSPFLNRFTLIPNVDGQKVFCFCKFVFVNKFQCFFVYAFIYSIRSD